MMGITPAVLTLRGMCVFCPPYTLRPTTRLAYCTGIFLVPCVNNTTKQMTKNIMPINTISDNKFRTSSLTSVISLMITFGNPDIIPTMIIKEIPFPIPFSVTRSPIHISSIVPVTILTIAVSTNNDPGLITT